MVRRFVWLGLVLAEVLLTHGWARAQNNTQVAVLPTVGAAPAADCDMAPNTGGGATVALSGAWTVQYIGFHRGSVGNVTTWGPCIVKQYRGVRECRVEFLHPVPALCTLPNIVVEQSTNTTDGFNLLTTFTGGTPPATQTYDHRDPVGPVIRASLASDITDTDCDVTPGGVGQLDLVVACGY
jgi:hypothetical protein